MSDYNGYVKSHFDTTAFFNNSFTSENPSVIGRLANLMVNAIETRVERKQQPLPKLIVLVTVNDAQSQSTVLLSTTHLG